MNLSMGGVLFFQKKMSLEMQVIKRLHFIRNSLDLLKRLKLKQRAVFYFWKNRIFIFEETLRVVPLQYIIKILILFGEKPMPVFYTWRSKGEGKKWKMNKETREGHDPTEGPGGPVPNRRPRRPRTRGDGFISTLLRRRSWPEDGGRPPLERFIQ